MSQHDREDERGDAGEAAQDDLVGDEGVVGVEGEGTGDVDRKRSVRDDPLARSDLDYGADDRAGDASARRTAAENGEGSRAERA